MTVWTPALWNPGDNFTSDQANTLLSGPYYHLLASADQTIPAAAATALAFDTVIEYNSRYASVSTPATSLAVPITGIYLIVAQATFTAAATGVREAYLTADGTVVGGVSAVVSTARPWAGQVTATKKLSAAATIAVSVYQDSGDVLDTSATTLGGCRLTVTWLGLR